MKINFDEEDEDIGDYETDEEDAKPSRAMSLINHARHTVMLTTYLFIYLFKRIA